LILSGETLATGGSASGERDVVRIADDPHTSANKTNQGNLLNWLTRDSTWFSYRRVQNDIQNGFID
jgi:hypothetical protein